MNSDFSSPIFNKNILAWQVVLPILTILLLTPWSAKFDLLVSHFFFTHGHFATHPFFDFIYVYGLLPAWICVFLAFLVLILALFVADLRKWRKGAWLLILTLALGSGGIIHACFKDNWGRPRPKQVVEFGGHQVFRPYYQPNFSYSEPSKSFPCGHCSLGFYFFALALLGLHYRQKFVYYMGLMLAWGLGGILGFVRIAQGGHFLSDVLISALIMWLVSLGLYQLLFRKEGYERFNSETTCHS